MSENPDPTARFAAEAVAAQLLSHLQRSGQGPHPVAVVRTGGGWTVLVSAFATPPDNPTEGLTQCDKDCLALLAQVSCRFPGERVRDELERRRIGIWSVVTVKRSLARLKRMGLVCNSKRKPRGYYLPECLPLLRFSAGQ